MYIFGGLHGRRPAPGAVGHSKGANEMNKFYNILLSQIIAQSKGEKETISLSDNDIDEWKKAFNLKYNVDIDDAIEQNGDDQTLSIKNADVLNCLSEDIKEFLYEVLENQKDDIEPDSMGYFYAKTLASLLAFVMPEAETQPPDNRNIVLRQKYHNVNDLVDYYTQNEFNNKINNYRTLDGGLIELNAKQRKLITSLKNMLDHPQFPDYPHTYTLDYIIRFCKGQDSNSRKPTKADREEYAAMLQYFMLPVRIFSENGLGTIDNRCGGGRTNQIL